MRLLANSMDWKCFCFYVNCFNTRVLRVYAVRPPHASTLMCVRLYLQAWSRSLRSTCRASSHRTSSPSHRRSRKRCVGHAAWLSRLKCSPCCQDHTCPSTTPRWSSSNTSVRWPHTHAFQISARTQQSSQMCLPFFYYYYYTLYHEVNSWFWLVN